MLGMNKNKNMTNIGVMHITNIYKRKQKNEFNSINDYRTI